jgi:hypothetical protein
VLCSPELFSSMVVVVPLQRIWRLVLVFGAPATALVCIMCFRWVSLSSGGGGPSGGSGSGVQ